MQPKIIIIFAISALLALWIIFPPLALQNKTPKSNKPSSTSQKPATSAVTVTKALISEALDSSNMPVGEGSVFSPRYGELVYFAYYKGATSNRTKMIFQWSKDGKVIDVGSFVPKASVGYVWHKVSANFSPGTYYVQLIADGWEVNKTMFKVSLPKTSDANVVTNAPKSRATNVNRTNPPQSSANTSAGTANNNSFQKYRVENENKRLIDEPKPSAASESVNCLLPDGNRLYLSKSECLQKAGVQLN